MRYTNVVIRQTGQQFVREATEKECERVVSEKKRRPMLTDGLSDRQADRQTDRPDIQTDRQTDR